MRHELSKIDLTELEAMKHKITQLVEKITNLVISDDSSYTTAGEYVKSIRRGVKHADDVKREIKQPVLEASRAIDARYNEIVSPLKEAEQHLRNEMGIFMQKKKAAEQKAQDDAVMKTAERAAQRGDAAKSEMILQRGSELAIDKQTMRTENATVSTRTVFDSYEIVDFEKVPDAFKQIDVIAVRKHVNGVLGTRDSHEISGLKITTKEQVSVR